MPRALVYGQDLGSVTAPLASSIYRLSDAAVLDARSGSICKANLPHGRLLRFALRRVSLLDQAIRQLS